MEKGEIDNIEQYGYTHNERSAFPRNLARFVNGMNCLHQYRLILYLLSHLL